MDKKISVLTVSYTVFLIFLFVSGALSGLVSDIVYYLAFVIPIALSLFLIQEDLGESKKYLTIDREGMKRFLPLIFPTISAIVVISILTSIFISAVSGKNNNVDVGDSFILALLNHALLPALFEETLFRYIPIKLLAPHSPRATIIISAFFFSLIHADLFIIPYAFFAGVILMAIDLACDSIIPSVVIHFINNSFSVILIFVSDNHFALTAIYAILIVMTIVSIFAIIDARDDYENALIRVTEKRESVKFTSEMFLFLMLTLAISIIKLL